MAILRNKHDAATEDQLREMLMLLDHPANEGISDSSVQILIKWLNEGETGRVLSFLREGTE